MKRLCIIVFVAFTVIGCTRTRVGVRGGVDVPLTNATGKGDITETSVSAGAVYGLTLEVMSKKAWGVRIDPQLRTATNKLTVRSVTVGDSTIAQADAQLNATAQFLELPLLFTVNPVDTSSPWQPFFSFGAMMSLGVDVEEDLNATQTVATNRGTQTSDLVVFSSGRFQGNDYWYLLYSGGIRYVLSKSFELRFETRLQHLLTDNTFNQYIFDAQVINNDFIGWQSVYSTVPTLTLGITLSAIVRL
jgi:hypothetical protein